MSAPHGRVVCAAGAAVYVSGAKSRHWWRCPSCQWVGWPSASKHNPPIIGRHHVPAPVAPVEVEQPSLW